MNAINLSFSIFIEIVGWILLITNFTIDNAYDKDDCKNKTIRNCNKGVLMIAVTFILVPLMYWLVLAKCDCAGLRLDIGIELYAVFIGILGIVLIVLGALITERSSNTGCSKTDTGGTVIWVMGMLMLIAALAYGGFAVFETVKGKGLGMRTGRARVAR